MKVAREVLAELLEDAKEIDRQPWRHGSRVRYLFAIHGKHYAISIDVHVEEGAQIYGDVELKEVRAEQVTVTRWVELGETAGGTS